MLQSASNATLTFLAFATSDLIFWVVSCWHFSLGKLSDLGGHGGHDVPLEPISGGSVATGEGARERVELVERHGQLGKR